MKNGDWSEMRLTGKRRMSLEEAEDHIELSLRDGSSDLPITEQDVEAARVHDAHQRSLSLNESDPDEREALRGPVSASRAVLDGQRGAPRIREDDERLRRARLAAIELQGVVEGARLSGVEELLMLVRYLPGSFINAYLSMIDAAFGERALGSGTGAGVEGSGREYGARSGVATKSEVIGHRDGAHWSGKSSADVGIPIRSEKASEELSRLKKRLRGMAREILVSLSNGDTEPVSRRRCSGRCARLGDVEWLFCPNCGGPMSDVVKKKNRS